MLNKAKVCLAGLATMTAQCGVTAASLWIVDAKAALRATVRAEHRKSVSK